MISSMRALKNRKVVSVTYHSLSENACPMFRDRKLVKGAPLMSGSDRVTLGVFNECSSP